MDNRNQKSSNGINNAQKELIAELEKTKSFTKIEKMKTSMSKIYEIAKKTECSILQKFIILFQNYYNPLMHKTKSNEKLIQLSSIMIKQFFKENIVSIIRDEIIKLFPENQIFSAVKDIDDYEMCFILCNLVKDNKIMETFFKEYLGISIFEQDEYYALNFENPHVKALFEDIFQKIHDRQKQKNQNEIQDLKIIVQNCKDKSNFSRNNLFRCNKCYDIMHMKLNNNNNIEFKCQECDKEYKELSEKDTLRTFYTKFFCFNCKNQIILYKENFKCVSCKNLLCMECKIHHLKMCFSLNYIKIYDVGFKCESHSQNYIEYCFSCKKNLCQRCKIIHQHITNDLKSIDKEVCSKKYLSNSLVFDKNELIRYNLTQIFSDLKARKLFNGYIYEIACALFKININDNQRDIYFKQFNNNEFRNYYSKTLKKISQGSFYYLKCLNNIKSYYSTKKKKDFDFDYEKISEREKEIQKFIDQTKSILINLRDNHRFINYDHKVNYLKKKNNDLLITIEKTNMELLQYQNANRKNQENSHYILCRFFADKLLKCLIINYQDKMDKVSLTLKIFIDLAYTGNFNVFANKNLLDSIAKISKDFNEKIAKFKKNPNDKMIIADIIKCISSSKSSNLTFLQDIALGNVVYKKEDLNFILDLLFLVKNSGTKVAHPNIDPKDSIQIINIKDDLFKFNLKSFYDSKIKKNITNKSNQFLKEQKQESLPYLKNNTFESDIIDYAEEEEDKNLYYHASEYDFNNIAFQKEYNLFYNLEKYMNLAKDEIQKKIIEIRDQLKLRFNDGIININLKTKDIIDVIFNEDDEKAFNKTQYFMRTLIKDTDDVIKSRLNIQLEEHFSDDNESISTLVDILEIIQMMLNDFVKLKILKHKNLDEYINQEILKHGEQFSKYIILIEKLERKKFSFFNIDCLGNEIIAEVCFLILNKIFLREISKLESIINVYETEIIKNIIYEELVSKLKDIVKLFRNNFNTIPFKLTQLIETNLSKKENVNKLTLEQIKDILVNLLTKFDEPLKSEKLTLQEILFYHQNADNN